MKYSSVVSILGHPSEKSETFDSIVPFEGNATAQDYTWPCGCWFRVPTTCHNGGYHPCQNHEEHNGTE